MINDKDQKIELLTKQKEALEIVVKELEHKNRRKWWRIF